MGVIRMALLWILYIFIINEWIGMTQLVEAESLSTPPQYIVLCPKHVRPGLDVNVYVVLFHMNHHYMDISATISRDEEQVTSATQRFYDKTARLLQMRIPDNAIQGNYSVRVTGSNNESRGGFLFDQVKQMEFHTKQASLFIQTDKLVYNRRQWISYRIIAVKTNLLPVHTASINIMAKDPLGRITRRWEQQQLFNGYYENKFWVDFPAKFGWWTIEVEALGHVYKQEFKVENYFGTRFDVNLTMPAFVRDNEYAVAGTIIANLTNGMPVEGNATVVMEIRPKDPIASRKKRFANWIKVPKDDTYPKVDITIPYVKGVSGFSFPLEQVRRYVSQLAGTELRVYASVYDWYYMEAKTNMAVTRIISSRVLIRFLGGEVRTFKPGSPLDVYVAVYGEDGEKLPYKFKRQVRIQRQVTTQEGRSGDLTESVHFVGEESIVKYSYTPARGDKAVIIRARFEGGDKNYIELRAERHYTRSDHYVTVWSSTPQPQVNHYAIFNVRSTTFMPELHYQIIAKGNIITGGILFMKSQQKTFSTAVSVDMFPEASLIIFGMLPSGEIIADLVSFHVHDTIEEVVLLEENQGQDFTGNTKLLHIYEEAGSTFTGVSGQLLDMYSRGADTFLTQQKIEADLHEYDHTRLNRSFAHTWSISNGQLKSVYRNAPAYAIDTNTTFIFAGLEVITDANLTRIDTAQACNISYGDLPCFTNVCFRPRDQCDGVWQCPDGADEMGCETDDHVRRPSALSSMSRIAWHYDDHTWLWHTSYTQPHGNRFWTLDVPYRPAAWLVSAFTLHHDNGLKIRKSPIHINSDRHFYMNVEIPAGTINRGEQIGVQVSLFHLYHERLETVLTLHESSDYRFVMVEDFGIVSSYKPRLSSGDHQIMVHTRPGEMRYIHFPVLPIKIGAVKVTISLYNFLMKQTVTKTLKVHYDGVTNFYHTPYLVDLINSGSTQFPFLEINVPERFIDPGQRAHLYVPGSAKAKVSVSGGVVGPGIHGNMGLWKDLHRSSGQGEAYIFDFAFDLYWLKLLKVANKLSSEVMRSTLENMLKDLTIVYSYMKNDGSFSMFRSKSASSTGITAFGLEVLSDAIDTEWYKTLFIDVAIVNRVALWLCEQQHPETGSFGENGRWFDRKLLDPVDMVLADGSSRNITITAYTLIALVKAKRVVSSEAAHAVATAIIPAADYLADQVNIITDPFQLCITTYALYKADHVKRSDAFMRMRNAKRTGEFVYWSNEEIPPNEIKILDAKQYLQPRQEQANEAQAVQATSYALLVYLMENRYTESIPIMKFLQTQRNSDHGFVSTQDTLLALQALSEFAKRDTNRDLYNMLINLEATSTPNWTNSWHLNKDKFWRYNKAELPRDKVFGSIQATAEGTGYALVQLSVSVNVEYPRLMKKPVQPAFDLDIERLVYSGRNASRFDMRFCTRWLRTDLADRSGFAMIEVDVPTGFGVNKQTLKDSERAGPYDVWKRSRGTRQKVYMHLDYIPSTRTCFSFHGMRWFPVANATLQHMIRVYELHEPGNYNATLYTTYDLFHNHICQVCGSYQCPYCPYYNSAPATERMTTSVKSLAILSLCVLMSLIH